MTRVAQPRVGHSLAEYALVGALVFASAIGVLVLIGGNMKTTLGALKGDLRRNIAGAQAAEARRPMTPGGINGLVPMPGPNQLQACFEGNICINLPIRFANGATVQTAGSNGGELTQQYATALDQIIAQLRAENADPTLINLLTQHANNGHGVGQTETLFDGMCPVETYSSTGQSYYNGQTCLQSANTSQNNVNAVISQLKTSVDTFSQSRSDLENYLNANEGAMTPAIQQLIWDLTGEIDQGVGMVSSGAWTMYPQPVREVINVTRLNSNTICATGGRNCYRTSYNAPQ